MQLRVSEVMDRRRRDFTGRVGASRSPTRRPDSVRERWRDETKSAMMALDWFHPNLNRHAAECMLIDNAQEGSYLLRASADYQTDRSYSLSQKLFSSVRHIKVITLKEGEQDVYKFGNYTFPDVEKFRRHIELEKPVIGDDSGNTVELKFPYSRFVEERHVYTEVVHHSVSNPIGSSSSESEDESREDPNSCSAVTPLSINSKEGYLTKQGSIVKNWKFRWFVLRNKTLKYYKNKRSLHPKGVLDMNKAKSVKHFDSKEKDYCFAIEFPHRTYYIHAYCAEDCSQWVELLSSISIK